MEAYDGISTNECLADFLERYDWDKVQRFVAEFTGVGTQTVRRWKNGQTPVGTELLKVRVLLDLAGYSIRELNRLPEVIRDFAQIVAFGILSTEEATEMLGYTKVSGVFEVILRGGGAQVQRYHRIERFVEKSKDELAEAVNQLHLNLLALEPFKISEAEPSISEIESPMPAEPNSSLGDRGKGVKLGDPTSKPAPTKATRSSPDPLVSGLAYALLGADGLSKAIGYRPDSVSLVQELYTIVDRNDIRDIVGQLEHLIANPVMKD